MPSLRFTLPLALLGALLAAGILRASDAIPEPAGGRSATVTQPHVTAELIGESNTFEPGQAFSVVLHLHMDPGWHTYWTNPGDAGLATTIKWTIPMGLSGSGNIEWPTPEVHMMGPLTTYGYGGDVYLLTYLTPNGNLGENMRQHQVVTAHVSWLVCQEECIPGKADLSLTLEPNTSGKAAPIDPARQAFFDAVRARIPRDNSDYTVTAAYQGNQLALDIKQGRAAQRINANATILAIPGQPLPPGNFSFFAEQSNVLDTKSVQLIPDGGDGKSELRAHLNLIQNGEKPGYLSGVLVSGQPFAVSGAHVPPGDARALYIFPFAVTSDHFAPATTGAVATQAAPSSSVATAVSASSAAVSSTPASATSAPGPTLIPILFFAFLGGLILNLMPCVLPVLSLKVFSLIRHAGGHTGGAWKQGVAFTAGVVISFWILAGLLIALESAGSHLGWGFQMQSPGFVLALIFLFFLLGLNLFGVFELGTSLVGVDAKASSNLSGLPSSFANGALATLAATPCTAPFMGSAVGFAAQQPAAISLLVFTFLALGMASPYLALTAFPGALKLVPKPGRWMEALRQFMGFLLLGTVIFLVYVFGALTGSDSVPMLLGALLIAALGAWIFGRGTAPIHSTGLRLASLVAALLLLGISVGEGVSLAQNKSASPFATARDGWQVYSPQAVQQALAQGHPAFVDFTAAWCLSCKVNEQVALEIDSTKKLFSQKQVALFRGDWTHSDPQISDTLRQYNRNGVPLYLVYSPKNPHAPQVLPEVLTPGIVQDALQKLP